MSPLGLSNGGTSANRSSVPAAAQMYAMPTPFAATRSSRPIGTALTRVMPPLSTIVMASARTPAASNRSRTACAAELIPPLPARAVAGRSRPGRRAPIRRAASRFSCRARDAGLEHPRERLACEQRREPDHLGLAGLVGAVHHLRRRRDAEQDLEPAVDREARPRRRERRVQVDVGEDRGDERALLDPRPARVDEDDRLVHVRREEREQVGRPGVGEDDRGVAAAAVDVHGDAGGARDVRARAEAARRGRALHARGSRASRPPARRRRPPRAPTRSTRRRRARCGRRSPT